MSALPTNLVAPNAPDLEPGLLYGQPQQAEAKGEIRGLEVKDLAKDQEFQKLKNDYKEAFDDQVKTDAKETARLSDKTPRLYFMGDAQRQGMRDFFRDALKVAGVAALILAGVAIFAVFSVGLVNMAMVPITIAGCAAIVTGVAAAPSAVWVLAETRVAIGEAGAWAIWTAKELSRKNTLSNHNANKFKSEEYAPEILDPILKQIGAKLPEETNKQWLEKIKTYCTQITAEDELHKKLEEAFASQQANIDAEIAKCTSAQQQVEEIQASPEVSWNKENVKSRLSQQIQSLGETKKRTQSSFDYSNHLAETRIKQCMDSLSCEQLRRIARRGGVFV